MKRLLFWIIDAQFYFFFVWIISRMLNSMLYSLFYIGTRIELESRHICWSFKGNLDVTDVPNCAAQLLLEMTVCSNDWHMLAWLMNAVFIGQLAWWWYLGTFPFIRKKKTFVIFYGWKKSHYFKLKKYIFIHLSGNKINIWQWFYFSLKKKKKKKKKRKKRKKRQWLTLFLKAKVRNWLFSLQ